MDPTTAQNPGPHRHTEYGRCFFLSYSHTPRVFEDSPDPDHFVREFFRDLCHELVALDPRWNRPGRSGSPGPPGFMDDAIPNGGTWRRHLAAELASCRVFVPLYSRRYFTSKECGREWAVFRERQMAHVAQTGTPSDAVLPVLWQPPQPEDMPTVAQAVQWAQSGLPDSYIERGLFELIRLDRDRGYLQVVIRLAQRLDEIARSGAPPPGPQADYVSVRPLFPQIPGSDHEVRRLHITVAAPDVGSVPPGRDLNFYGPRPEDWRPYIPQSDVPLARRVGDVARGLGYVPVVSPLTGYWPGPAPSESRGSGGSGGSGSSDGRGVLDAPDPPDVSNVPDGPGIMLIDPWIAADGTPHPAEIVALDRRRVPWIRVLIPWNRDDVQTTARATQLMAGLQQLIPWSLAELRSRAPAATRDLTSLADLGHTMPSVVELAWRHYLRAVRPGPLGDYPPRPRLRGPIPPDPEGAGTDGL